MKNLDYFKKFKSGVDFMEGREKAALVDLCTGESFNVDNAAMMNGEDGDYAVFTVTQQPKVFYFGSSVVSEVLREVISDDMVAALIDAPVVFEQCESKKGRVYIKMLFV